MSIIDTLKKLWADLYENKPLFWAVLVIVALAAYLWWQNQQQQLTMPASAGTMPLIPTGTVPEGPPIVQQPPTTSGGHVPPGDLFPPGTHRGPGGGPGVGNPPPSIRTVTVTPWPTQTSTLWGIAQKFYGNGNQWQKIYNANKPKIGPNPNVIHPGTVLVVP